ncbi:hypothetical protein AAMO2058_000901500 [Amorphochlora amoebiformis]
MIYTIFNLDHKVSSGCTSIKNDINKHSLSLENHKFQQKLMLMTTQKESNPSNPPALRCSHPQLSLFIIFYISASQKCSAGRISQVEGRSSKIVSLPVRNMVNILLAETVF